MRKLPFENNDSKHLAVLIDPDKIYENTLDLIAQSSVIDFILVGGSLLHKETLSSAIEKVKAKIDLPVFIFPGNHVQVDEKADGIFLLSLISGRNPDFLIGQHVIAAPSLKRSSLDIIPTGYILIDCGNSTTASYISNTTPIPFDKPEIAACTALAGSQLGMNHFYLDGGSGAKQPVNLETITQVNSITDGFITVGGGIRTIESIKQAWNAGANMVVIGTAFEKDPSFVKELELLR